VQRLRHFRVYEVQRAAPIAVGPATVTGIGPNSVSLVARRPGHVFLRVRYTPYWKLGRGVGCVTKAGDFTALDLRRAGPAEMIIAFSLGRIGATTPRCEALTR
jgi:hypothetical protein